jgi:hypothetical protein
LFIPKFRTVQLSASLTGPANRGGLLGLPVNELAMNLAPDAINDRYL